MSRYGKPIEQDLAYRGIDLAESWRSRRWRKLLNLIDGLPPDSAFAEASAQDDELAEMMAELDEPVGDPSPRIRDFGPTNRILTGIYDRLGDVVAATVATIPNSKPVKIEPSRRPETAADRLSRRVANASADYILEQIQEARAREEAGDG